MTVLLLLTLSVSQGDSLNQSLEEDKLLYLHRFLGYGVLIGATVNVGLGYVYYNNLFDIQNSSLSDPIRFLHRGIGYSVLGASLLNSSTGFINFFKLKKRRGLRKRLVHMTLSSLATIGYVTAGVLSFKGKYATHRTVALLSLSSTLLTILWIIW
jgi:hypothetical protein